jgi:hypothetical protein
MYIVHVYRSSAYWWHKIIHFLCGLFRQLRGYIFMIKLCYIEFIYRIHVMDEWMPYFQDCGYIIHTSHFELWAIFYMYTESAICKKNIWNPGICHTIKPQTKSRVFLLTHCHSNDLDRQVKGHCHSIWVKVTWLTIFL